MTAGNPLGLRQAQTNLVFSLARAQGGLEGPVAGWAIEKFGNRSLLAPSIIFAAVGYFVFARFVPNYWSFVLVYLGMITLGNSVAFQHAMFTGLIQWFRRRWRRVAQAAKIAPHPAIEESP